MISGIILASGFSKRMGREKLLLPMGRIPIIERVIQSAVNSRLDEIILVYRLDAVKRIGESYPIRMVANPRAHQGQSAAVRTGMAAASAKATAFLFMVGDQPFITPDLINTVIAGHGETPTHIIIPTYAGKRGNPVLFPSSFKNELSAIRGDRGGIAVIKKAASRVRYIEIGNPSIGYDVDTPADYNRMKAQDPGD